MAKAQSWTSQEIAILEDVYPREGINGAADALPDRSWHAIEQRSHKLGLRSPIVSDAPKLVLHGERLEEAIRLHETGGWSFIRLAERFGVCPTAATNAILVALCPRRGFRPAERDATGRLTSESKERLRYMLKKGLKGVDIQLRLGLSAARIAKERRRYNADLIARGKATLQAPGAGEQYCGVKIPAAKRREAEAILLEGHGSTTAARRTGISVPSAKNIRRRLIARLARKGECLPGCDPDGRRLGAAKHSTHHISPDQVSELRRRLLAGEPVQPAARACGVGSCSAYRIRDQLAAELVAAGHSLPKPVRLGRGAARRARDSGDDWLPADRAQEFRVLVHEHGFADAKQLLQTRIKDERAAEATARAVERARPKCRARRGPRR